MKRKLWIAVLPALFYIGMTAYISQGIPSEATKFFKSLATHYAPSGLAIKGTVLENNLFRSKIAIEISGTTAKINEKMKKLYRWPLRLEYTMKHGPLLLGDGIKLGVMEVEGEASFQELFSEEFLASVQMKKENQIDSYGMLTFFQDLCMKIETKGFIYSDLLNRREIEVSQLSGMIDMNLKSKKSMGTLRVDALKLRSGRYAETSLGFEKLEMDINILNLLEKSIYLGKMHLSAKAVEWMAKKHETDLSFRMSADIDIYETTQQAFNMLYLLEVDDIRGKLSARSLSVPLADTRLKWMAYIDGLSLESLSQWESYTPELLLSKNATLGSTLILDKRGKEALRLALALGYTGKMMKKSLNRLDRASKSNFLNHILGTASMHVKERFLDNLNAEYGFKNKQGVAFSMGMMLSKTLMTKTKEAYHIQMDYSPDIFILNERDISKMLSSFNPI